MPRINVNGVGVVEVSDNFMSLSDKDKQKTVNDISKFHVGEKKESPEEKENWLFKTLDNINRPQYGVANAIYEAAVNDDYGVVENFWKGFSLEEKRSVGDTLREVIQPDSKVGKVAVGLAGFAGDVMTDPLTYVGVGLLNRGGKVVKAGSQSEKFIKAGRASGKAKDTKAALKFGGMTIPKSEIIADPVSRGLGKAGMAIREDLGPISNAINKLTNVSTKMRPKGVDPVVWQKVLTARDKAKNVERSVQLTAIEKSKEMLKAFKEEGIGEDQLASVANQIETQSKVTSKGGQIAQEARDQFQQRYQKVGETGKQIIEEDGYEYLPHVSVKKNKKIQNAIGINSREFTTKSPGDIRRTILKYTDESGKEFVMSTKNGKVFKDGKQINKFNSKKVSELQESGQLSQATISDINKAYGDTVFSANLPNLIAIQGMRTAKVVGGDEFFKNMSKLGSKTQKTVKGVDYAESTAPELAGKYFHPEIVKHIDASRTKLLEGDQKFFETFNKIQNAWKSQATYWNVAFHTRNAISNTWQNSLADVNNPVDYFKAGKIQFGLRKGIKNLAPDEQKIIKEYREQGLSRVGHLSGDISQSIESEIMSTMDALKRGGKGLVTAKGDIKYLGTAMNKVGGSAGDMVEGNSKLAHFIAKRKEGLSAFEAGQSVKKYLFDYEDLTDIEKRYFKTFMPFYTFTRKNIPLQLEALIKTPSKQTKLIKAKNNIEILAGDDNTEHILPEWLKNAAPVFVGKKGGKVRYIKLEGFLPIADLNKISDPGKDMLNMLSPVLKAPVEQISNHNFFFGSEITKQKGTKGFTGYGEKDLLWARVPGRIDHLAGLFRPIKEIDKLIGRKYETQDLQEKAMNLILGGKIYEYETKELLRKFNRLTDEDARNIKYHINTLKKESRKKPKLRDRNREDIQMLYKKLKISKRKAIQTKRQARRSLR